MHPDSCRNAPTRRALPALLGRALAWLVLLAGIGLAGCGAGDPTPLAVESGAEVDVPDTPLDTSPDDTTPDDTTPDGADDVSGVDVDDPDVEPGDGDGDAEPGPDVERKREEQRKQMDETGRGLMGSFRARVYDPLRDEGLQGLRGTATFRSGEIVATYSIAFDGTQDEDQQVAVEPGSVPPDTPKGTERQVLRFANHSLRGGCQTVVNYYPPVRLWFTRARDNARIVTAPPWKHNIQVSYRLDERDLVLVRGADAPRGREVVEFEWRFFRGRYLLERLTFKGTGATIEYEYDEWDGIALLREATIVRGESTMVTTFQYEALEKGEAETPLVPVLPDRDPAPDPGDDAERPR